MDTLKPILLSSGPALMIDMRKSMRYNNPAALKTQAYEMQTLMAEVIRICDEAEAIKICDKQKVA